MASPRRYAIGYNRHRRGLLVGVAIARFWRASRIDLRDSVSEEQVDLLVRAGFRNALLIFDGDAGGRAGTEQALPVLASRLFTKTLMLEDGDKPDVMSEELLKGLPCYVR
ncbi:MAG: hypothetical protein WBD01_13980 [Salaquimonas sp.]